MADYLLLFLGVLCLLIGLIGCVLPVIPGPPISWLSLLILNYTRFADFSSKFLTFFAIIAIVVTIIDYIVPVWGTRKFGGSKAGIWGATIGLIVGLFFLPPIGIVLGPFAGAFIAESIRGADNNVSFKAAMGSLFGFFLGIGIKLISSFVMAYYFFKTLIH